MAIQKAFATWKNNRVDICITSRINATFCSFLKLRVLQKTLEPDHSLHSAAWTGGKWQLNYSLPSRRGLFSAHEALKKLYLKVKWKKKKKISPMKKPEQTQTYCQCNFAGCIPFFLHYLPFISFNFVKSRSKLSTSASPAVRLASSWMSKSVIASEEINTDQETKKQKPNKSLFSFNLWFSTVERKSKSVQQLCSHQRLCLPVRPSWYHFPTECPPPCVRPLLANWKTAGGKNWRMADSHNQDRT